MSRSHQTLIPHGIALLCLASAGHGHGALQQPGVAAEERMLRTFSKPIDGVNWDELSPHYQLMIERMFERNGWIEEPDRFAMDVAMRVVAIPPWDVAGRLKALTEEVADRYELTPAQASGYQRLVMREAAGFLMRHGPAVWGQAKEAVQGRSLGNPYTPEQIARWAELGKPLFKEFEEGVERISKELELTLSEEKKAVLAQDMASFRRRQTAVVAMNDRWAKGEWRAEEWGLEDDPIQKRVSETVVQPAAATGQKPVNPGAEMVEPNSAVAIPTKWIEHDSGTWIALVIEYRERFSLDSGQMDTARSILAELVERAERYSNGRREALATVPPVERATSPAFEPIRELFKELRERLDALPTSRQREASGKK